MLNADFSQFFELSNCKKYLLKKGIPNYKMNIYFTVRQLKTLFRHFYRSYNINNADDDEQHSPIKTFHG